ncbi:hypothetical protein RYO59_001615 [Thermosynechococcaceae cyanobacterium Okahandja]
MSEATTRSELSQVLDEIKAMRSDIKAMQTQLYDLTLEVRTNQATTNEKFNTLEEKVNSVRTELKTEIQSVRTELKTEIQSVRTELTTELKAVDEKVTDLSDRQRVVDSRLWGFIVALVGAIVAYLVKLSFFDKI